MTLTLFFYSNYWTIFLTKSTEIKSSGSFILFQIQWHYLDFKKSIQSLVFIPFYFVAQFGKVFLFRGGVDILRNDLALNSKKYDDFELVLQSKGNK